MNNRVIRRPIPDYTPDPVKEVVPSCSEVGSRDDSREKMYLTLLSGIRSDVEKALEVVENSRTRTDCKGCISDLLESKDYLCKFVKNELDRVNYRFGFKKTIAERKKAKLEKLSYETEMLALTVGSRSPAVADRLVEKAVEYRRKIDQLGKMLLDIEVLNRC